MGTTVNKVRVNVGVDKESAKTRSDRAKVVGATAPSSPIYQAQPEVKSSCDSIVALGAEMVVCEQEVHTAELVLAKARSARDEKQIEFDAAYGVCTSQVEKHSATPADVQGLGFSVLDRGSYEIAPPVAVRARFDTGKEMIRIQVEQAPGMRACVLEISADASEPRTWKRLPGVGSRRTVSGYAPGTYWIHAASVRASEQSEFTAAVPVTVR